MVLESRRRGPLRIAANSAHPKGLNPSTTTYRKMSGISSVDAMTDAIMVSPRVYDMGVRPGEASAWDNRRVFRNRRLVGSGGGGVLGGAQRGQPVGWRGAEGIGGHPRAGRALPPRIFRSHDGAVRIVTSLRSRYGTSMFLAMWRATR